MNEVPNQQPNQAQGIRVALPPLAPKATYAILGFTVFIYILQFISRGLIGYDPNGLDILEHFAARSNDAIRAGELWRFITPVFLHGPPLHIFFNMYALFVVGSFIERQFGYNDFYCYIFLLHFQETFFRF